MNGNGGKDKMETQEEKIKGTIKQKYKIKETFELIEKFLEKQSQLSLIKRISFEKELREKTAEILTKERELGIIAVGLCRLKNQYLFLNRIIETKLTYLVRSMIFGLNDDNHLLLALCSRSLIEHAASLSYLIEWTNRILERTKGTMEYKSINKNLEELYTIYRKIFYGTRFFKNEGLIEATNVLTLVDKYLSPEIKDVRKYYDYLSDFVHPNFGSNVLVSSGELGEGIVDPSIEEKKEIIENILQITGVIIKYVDYKVLDFASLGILIDNYLQKALHPDTTLSTLFVEPLLEYMGDGKSKETAIFFINVTTKAEHIMMQYEFMRKQGIKSTMQLIGGIEGDYIYDVHETQKGKLWFKVPKE